MKSISRSFPLLPRSQQGLAPWIAGRSAARSIPATRSPLGFVVWSLVVAFLGACTPTETARELKQFRGETMGTTFSVKIVRPSDHPLTGAEQQALAERIEAELDAVNESMSTYIDDSELMRFNRSAGDEPVKVSERFGEVVESAIALAERTGGAFDPTVGPLVDAWGFGPEGIERAPDEDMLRDLAHSIGYEKLRYDPSGRRLSKTTPELRVDLSALAKGYAVDQIFEALLEMGETDVLVEVGGETRVAGHNANGALWRLGIEKPQRERAVQRLVELGGDVGAEDGGAGDGGSRDSWGGDALATSGDYRNIRRIGRDWVSHLVDPRTGEPVDHRVASVSVVRPTCMESDALATALMILGDAEGIAWSDRNDVAALFLVREGDHLVERPSRAFAARFLSDSPSR